MKLTKELSLSFNTNTLEDTSESKYEQLPITIYPSSIELENNYYIHENGWHYVVPKSIKSNEILPSIKSVINGIDSLLTINEPIQYSDDIKINEHRTQDSPIINDNTLISRPCYLERKVDKPKNKRAKRRKYSEVERKFKCNYSGCFKGYGTLNHLNEHIKIQSHGIKRFSYEFRSDN